METKNIETGCNKWYKEIEKILHQCFKKIKLKNVPPKKTQDYKIYKALSDLKHMKELLAISTDMSKPTIQVEIEKQEYKVARLQGDRISKILNDNANLLEEDDSFSFTNAWKLKKKLFPRCSEAPFAVRNKEGELATDYEGILNVMKDEFTYRLRNREINAEYKELKELKEYLCSLRLEISRTSNYDKWTTRVNHSGNTRPNHHK